MTLSGAARVRVPNVNNPQNERKVISFFIVFLPRAKIGRKRCGRTDTNHDTPAYPLFPLQTQAGWLGGWPMPGAPGLAGFARPGRAASKFTCHRQAFL